MNLVLLVSRRQMWLARAGIATLIVCLILLVLFGPGEIKVERTSEATTYSQSLFLPILFAVLGGVGCLIGFFYWKQPNRFFRMVGVALFLIGGFALFNSPTGWNHCVIVAPGYFFHRIGSWYSPVEARIEFDSLVCLQIDQSESAAKASNKYELCCTRKSDGKEIRIPIHDLLKKALPEIFERAADHNVLIGESPDGRPIPRGL